jgi:16S rRNA (cytosine967-C5)-methyltransferase
LDAPCTGLGALRRRPDARWTKSVNNLKDLILLQRQLLASAAKAIKESGSIYYITCSPHKAETDLMISEFLIDHTNFKLDQIGKTEPTDLKSDLQSKYFRTWTHLGQGDSMFMAKLTRVS